MISGLIGLLSLGILFYISLIYTSPALILLTFCAAVFVLLSFVFLMIQRRLLEVRLEVPIAIADVQDPVTVCFHIKNRGMALHRLKLFVGAGNTLLYRKDRFRLRASDIPRGESCLTYTIRLPQAGNYEISLEKVILYDLTGVFCCHTKDRKNRPGKRGYVQVLPEASAVEIRMGEPVRHFFGEADSYAQDKPGHDNSETFRFREFAPGDKMQMVHWKLSAKSDALIVRELSLPKACPVVLFLDYHKSQKAQSPWIFLKVASSLSFSLMDAGCPHYVAWYEEKNRDITRIRVDDEESYFYYLTDYLQEQGSTAPQDVVTLYGEKYRSEHYIYALRLTETNMLYLQDEKIAQFTAENLERELGGLEIVL